jgi:hypothetical protein
VIEMKNSKVESQDSPSDETKLERQMKWSNDNSLCFNPCLRSVKK